MFNPLLDSEEFAKTLGIEWSNKLDCFRLAIAKLPPLELVTKRSLISDVAKTFDIIGWFAPAIILIKILLQQLWEEKNGWDDSVPVHVLEVWERWRKELPVLADHFIPRCYFPSRAQVVLKQLHGFSYVSEAAYAGVVYLHGVDSSGTIYVSLIMSKSKVAPIRRLTVPRLELWGANLLAGLLNHVQEIFEIPSSQVFAWTDSTVVLGWLSGNPRRFKTFVGNRVSNILELIPPDRWRHVSGVDNPADSSSRGMFPSELLQHELWWNGPNLA